MKSSRSGQSIIEAMVALSILTVGLVGILTLLTRSFALSRGVDDKTTATYLAAEGIEVTKSLIDHDVYSGFSAHTDRWQNCFPYSPPFTIYVEVDYQSSDCSTLNPQLTAISYPLWFNFNSATNLYSYSDTDQFGTGTKSIFSRSVSVTAPANGNELDVQSTVYWTDSFGGHQSITLEDHFYNWYPGN